MHDTLETEVLNDICSRGVQNHLVQRRRVCRYKNLGVHVFISGLQATENRAHLLEEE